MVGSAILSLDFDQVTFLGSNNTIYAETVSKMYKKTQFFYSNIKTFQFENL